MQEPGVFLPFNGDVLRTAVDCNPAPFMLQSDKFYLLHVPAYDPPDNVTH